jgi:hypothetical protein
LRCEFGSGPDRASAFSTAEQFQGIFMFSSRLFYDFFMPLPVLSTDDEAEDWTPGKFLL